MTDLAKRLKEIDAVRGLAVAVMVLANLGPVLAQPHSFEYRLFGSFAAPVFVFLVGLMVAISSARHGFVYFLKRGLLVLVFGALVDIFAWQILPFRTVDVLYLIGIAIPICFLLRNLSVKTLGGLGFLVFAIAQVLQVYFGYASYPSELDLDGSPTVEEIENMSSVLSHWFIDGWFPIFPWIGFSFLGLAAGKLTQQFHTMRITKVGLIATAIGGLIWLAFPGPMFDREGFSELFYPAVFGFSVSSFGVVLLLLNLFSRTRDLLIWDPLRVLGESPLFMYVFHLVLIGRFVLERWEELGFSNVLGIFAAILVSMLMLGYLLRKLKSRVKFSFLPVKVLIGS